MKEIKQYVKGYNQCQRIKNRVEMPAGKLRPNKVLERLWQHILVDFITKLPMLKGYNSILVVYDKFSKILHFVVTIEKITVEELVRLFRDNIWKLYRLPECQMQVHPSGNYIPTVKSSPKHTSLPFTAATFLITCFMTVLQPSGYSVFHGGNTPIQLSFP